MIFTTLKFHQLLANKHHNLRASRKVSVSEYFLCHSGRGARSVTPWNVILNNTWVNWGKWKHFASGGIRNGGVVWRNHQNKPALKLFPLRSFNAAGSLAPLTKRVHFFPNLTWLTLSFLNMDERDLHGLVDSLRSIPNLNWDPGNKLTTSTWVQRTGCNRLWNKHCLRLIFDITHSY